LSEIQFICPYCLQYVKSPLVNEGEQFFVRCPNCYPKRLVQFPVKVEVTLPDGIWKAIASERIRKLQSELCDWDGIGYTLIREYWSIALQNAYVEFWESGENGYAFLKTSIPVVPESRPPEIFWNAYYVAFGNFQDLNDPRKPEKVRQLYVVESEEEARFIMRIWRALENGRGTENRDKC